MAYGTGAKGARGARGGRALRGGAALVEGMLQAALGVAAAAPGRGEEGDGVPPRAPLRLAEIHSPGIMLHAQGRVKLLNGALSVPRALDALVDLVDKHCT